MEYRIGERQFEAGSRYLTLELRASNDLLDDPAALRRRLAEELHASLVNATGRYRLSCDTRYQRAGDPMDDRWAGVAPRGHSAFWLPGASLEPVEVSRRRWGI